jgi:hypothetical protein
VIPDGNVGLVPNVGIVVGSRATLVIDPGLDSFLRAKFPDAQVTCSATPESGNRQDLLTPSGSSFVREWQRASPQL